MNKIIKQKPSSYARKCSLNGSSENIYWMSPGIELFLPDTGAFIHTESGYILERNTLTFEGLSHRDYDPKFYFENNFYNKQEFANGNIIHDNNRLTINNGIFLPHITNFGHFCFELLPRLFALEQLDKNLPILICRGLPKKFIELIEVLSGRQVVEVSKHTFLSVGENIIIPGCPIRRNKNRELLINLDAWLYIRQTILAKYNEIRDESQNTFLSRGKSITWRRIVNEDSICQYLKNKFNMKQEVPDQLSIKQQVSLMQSSAKIFGLVGSQMMIASFANLNSKLMIAYPPGLALNYQLYIPLILGMQCFTTDAEAMNDPDIKFGHLNSDVQISCENLTKRNDFWE
jgi:hypothetical protein